MIQTLREIDRNNDVESAHFLMEQQVQIYALKRIMLQKQKSQNSEELVSEE